MLEKDLFLAALDITDPAERSAYLGKACGTDAGLRAAVEALLREHERAGSFLEGPPAAFREAKACTAVRAEDATITYVAVEQVGNLVAGRYQLLQKLGEGGMGTVFLAEQREPVHRQVALKIITPGMDSTRFLARFEQEWQALALMDHPNIAKVFDAGTTDAGQPYFVMELVQGVPFTRYCDEHRLTIRQRLELFVPVCQAVQHAHQKGIIHRDLKSSNVLVACYDGRPVPKVIDFGIAKATGQKLTEQTLCTEFGSIVGTLEYMSPEQAEAKPLDIDTRSDIYSLGVLLYELLTGTTPLERRRLRELPLLDVLRLIREEEPPRPSARLTAVRDLRATAVNRGVEAARLSGLVRGELDWIVMKCLEKDRNRRYETAFGLARDVERFLHHEPVQACPPSASYRLRKFCQRNKRPLATTALLAVMLLAVTGTLGWVARDRAARQTAREHETAQALQDVEESYRLDKLSAALVSVKRAEGLLEGGTAREELHQGVRQWRADLEVVGRLEKIRLDRAAVRDGDFDWQGTDQAYQAEFRRYGVDVEKLDPERAATLIRASAIRARLVAALDDWVVSTVFTGIAGREELLAVARRADPDAWRNRLRDAILEKGPQAREVLAKLAGNDEVLAQPPATLLLLARALRQKHMMAHAADVLGRAQQRHANDFWINHNLALYLENLKPPKVTEAVGFFRAALALRPESPGVRMNLSVALAKLGQLTEAEAEARTAIRLQPEYAEAHGNLGGLLCDRKKDYDGAIAAFRESLRLNPERAVGHFNLGIAFHKSGKLPEAEAAFREAVRLQPDYADAHGSLGGALAQQGKLAEAEAAYRQSLRLKPANVRVCGGLARVLRQQRRFADVEAVYRELLLRQPKLAEAHVHLGEALGAQEKLAEAIACYRRALQLEPGVPAMHNGLGLLLLRTGDDGGAVAAFRRAVALNPNIGPAHTNLGNALASKGDVEGALACHRRAVELDPTRAGAHFNLGNALARKGLHEAASAAFRETIRRDPKHVGAHNNLGMALRAKGDDANGALAAFRRAIELDPHFGTGYNNLGLALQDRGDLDGAIAAFRRAIELRPNGAPAHNNLGLALLARKDGDGALTAFRRAVELDPKYGPAHRNLGVALRDRGDLDGAIAALRRAIQLRTDLPRTHYELGLLLEKRKDYDGAAASLRESLRLRPEVAAAHHALATVLRRQGKPGPAESAYRAAVSLQPDYAEAHVDLALLLHDYKRDAREAAAACREAIRLKPDWAKPHDVLGLILLKQRKGDEAEAAFREAIRVEPGYVHAYNNLGMLLCDVRRDYDAAIDAFHHALCLEPESARPHCNLANALRLQDKLAEAEAAYREALRLEPAYVFAHRGLGRVLARNGQWESAAAAYNRAIELDPNSLPGWYLGAALRLQVGDVDGYRSACRAILERHGTTDKPDVMAGTTMTCSLAPAAVGAFERVVKLAERSVAGTEKHRFYRSFLLARALADYRAGRPDSAVAWVERMAPKAEGGAWDAAGFAVLALARHRLAQENEARAALAQALRARQLLDPGKGRPLGEDWHFWLHSGILCREAEGLLNAGKRQEPPPQQR